VLSRPMGAEGLEPSGQTAGETALSEMPGAQAGAIETETDCQGQLKARALEDLQRAWKSLRRLEDSSGDPSESKAAGRAVALVDKAFAALEGNER
jgi:hypothetical protein